MLRECCRPNVQPYVGTAASAAQPSKARRFRASSFAPSPTSATLPLAMDYLWTPWRYAYVSTAEKAPTCVFCDAVKAGDDAKARIVHRAEHCFVILNTFPYTPGHVMIVPYAHL